MNLVWLKFNFWPFSQPSLALQNIFSLCGPATFPLLAYWKVFRFTRSYGYFQTQSKTITVDYVKNLLLQDVMFKNDSNEQAMVAKGRSKDKNKKQKKKLKCYNCNGDHVMKCLWNKSQLVLTEQSNKTEVFYCILYSSFLHYILQIIIEINALNWTVIKVKKTKYYTVKCRPYVYLTICGNKA